MAGTGLVLPTLVACDEVPDAAIAAWRGPPPSLTDPRLRAVSWALLAPSPLNTQPWQVTASGERGLLLGLNPARRLPVLDPSGRQGMIACGAFLELLAMAAGQIGHRARIDLQPEVQAGPIAVLQLDPDAADARDDLFQALPLRRSTRLAFDWEKPLKPHDADALTRAAAAGSVGLDFVTSPEPVTALRELTRKAFLTSYATPASLAERAAWLRLGASEIAARQDGMALAGSSIWWSRRLGLLSREALAKPDSLAWRMGRLQWENLFAGTVSFGWLVTADDRTASRIAAGRVYQRVDLAAARQGVAIHPVSEALEAEAPRRQLETLLAVRPPARVQMLFRLGYAGPQPRAPRRSLSDVLRVVEPV
jgi:hypothetical protein